MTKRLIAMLLVLATMLSLMGSAAPAVIGEGAVSDAAVEEVIAAAVADEAASDYTADIGKHAEFSADLVATDWIEVLDTEPAEAWSSMLYNRYEFSDDIRFEIIDRKVVAEYYDVTDEETGEVTGQSAMYSLWYCVNVVAGTAVPEGFLDGYWILQNYLDEDAYEVDTLRLFAVCPVCKEEDCTDEHVYCDICGKYDCEIEHYWDLMETVCTDDFDDYLCKHGIALDSGVFTDEQLASLDAHYERLPERAEMVYTPWSGCIGPLMPPVYLPIVDVVSGKSSSGSESNDSGIAAVADTFSALDNSALKTSKIVTDNGDGTYTITIEAYAEGTVTVTTTKTAVDVVLVLDMSSSMKSNFSDTLTREEAVEDATQAFAAAVIKDGTDNNVDHRVAVVTYNKEVSVKCGLKNVLTNATAITNAVSNDSLATSQGTRSDYGLEAAIDVFSSNGVTNDTYTSEERQRVVVFFTDGYPSTSGSTNFNGEYAEAAINYAHTLKDTYGATVYSVAVLDDADPSDTPLWTGKTGNNASIYLVDGYLHAISSNYPDATATYSNNTLTISNTESGSNKDYYLTASTPEDLNGIFDTVSSTAISGSTSVNLGTTTEVTDIVTPYFVVPANTGDVSATVVDCTGYKDGAYTWATSGNPLENAVSIDSATNTLDVSGFDFTANYVASKGRYENITDKTADFYGRKLVITFKVTPDPDFLGGSGVPTNDQNSGIYDSSGTLYENLVAAPGTFDLPLKNISTVAQNRKIYYGNTVNLVNILNLNVVESTSGNSLQEIADGINNAYVDLQYTVSWTNEQGETVTVYYTIPAGTVWDKGTWSDVPENMDMSQIPLTTDTSYSIECVMSDANGNQTEKTASGTAWVFVYKPTITFKDSVKIPNVEDSVDYEADNFESITWVGKDIIKTTNEDGIETETIVDRTYEDGSAAALAAIEGAHQLYLTYTPDANCVADDDTVISGQDFHVNVTVWNKGGTADTSDDVALTDEQVTKHVKFAHKDCDLVSPCGFDSTKGEFMIHVSTGNLEITKDITVLDGNNPPNPTDFTFTVVPADDATATAFAATGKYTYYINGVLQGEQTVTDGKLTVTLDDMEYEEVRTIRIVGLPVGDYTVEEADVTGFATNFAGDETYEYTASATITRNTTVKLDCENVFPVYVGNLTLTKNVEKEYGGDTVDSEQEFTFTVTLTPENGVLDVLRKFACTKQVGDGAVEAFDLEFADSSTSATINVTLKAGETVSFTGLPVGKYDIAETEVTGFTTTSTGASGEIETSETASAVFTNTLEHSTGSLKIIKIVDNKTDEALGAYDFTFIVTMPTGTTYEEYASSFTTIPEGVTIEAFSDTENQFKITVHFDSIASGKGNNAEVTLVGVPSGEYFIDETPVVGFGATWSEADQKVTVTKDETAEITCTNTYPINNGELTIVKKLTEASDEDQTFVFDVAKADATVMRVTVTVPAGDTEKSVTIEGLELGTYTVTEDENWNWRYSLQSASPNGDVTLSATTPTATKTFTNKYSKNKWLSDEVSVKNIFTASGELKSTKIN